MTAKKTGVQIIADERARQMDAEGHSAESDDAHDRGELALAAICYAARDGDVYLRYDDDDEIRFVDPWPWSATDDKRPRDAAGRLKVPADKQYVRNLAKAGALIAAEIDRMQRVFAARRH